MMRCARSRASGGLLRIERRMGVGFRSENAWREFAEMVDRA
jgi:hypothetical protein